jgi:hypothetical protein
MTDRTTIATNALPSNPTPLSAPQEQQVRDLYYKNVRAKCASEIESTSLATSHIQHCILYTSSPLPIARGERIEELGSEKLTLS